MIDIKEIEKVSHQIQESVWKPASEEKIQEKQTSFKKNHIDNQSVSLHL